MRNGRSPGAILDQDAENAHSRDFIWAQTPHILAELRLPRAAVSYDLFGGNGGTLKTRRGLRPHFMKCIGASVIASIGRRSCRPSRLKPDQEAAALITAGFSADGKQSREMKFAAGERSSNRSLAFAD